LYLARADCVLLCCDPDTSAAAGLWPWAREASDCRSVVVVGTKADLGPAPTAVQLQTSAKTGEGLDALLEVCVRAARPAVAAEPPPPESSGGWWGAC